MVFVKPSLPLKLARARVCWRGARGKQAQSRRSRQRSEVQGATKAQGRVMNSDARQHLEVAAIVSD